jgi:hypothetical protein
MTNEEWEIIGQFAKDIVDRFNDQEKRIKNLEKQIEILSESELSGGQDKSYKVLDAKVLPLKRKLTSFNHTFQSLNAVSGKPSCHPILLA